MMATKPTTLSPAEIKKGAWVSILEWHVHYHHERSWVGDVLTVVSINLPFIACRIETQIRTPTVTLDTRIVELVELSDEFVFARCPALAWPDKLEQKI
jgi:hypothetical protein